MYLFLIVIYAILCLALIGLILLQRGRGSQTGLTYDPQASVFGASGSVSFLVKLTAVLAICFFVLGIVISINFRDSIEAGEKSLIEAALLNEEAREEAEAAEEAAALPDDVPVAEMEADGDLSDLPEAAMPVDAAPAEPGGATGASGDTDGSEDGKAPQEAN